MSAALRVQLLGPLQVERDGQPALDVGCGLYACSPKGAGFVAEFGYLDVARGRLK